MYTTTFAYVARLPFTKLSNTPRRRLCALFNYPGRPQGCRRWSLLEIQLNGRSCMRLLGADHGQRLWRVKSGAVIGGSDLARTFQVGLAPLPPRDHITPLLLDCPVACALLCGLSGPIRLSSRLKEYLDPWNGGLGMVVAARRPPARLFTAWLFVSRVCRLSPLHRQSARRAHQCIHPSKPRVNGRSAWVLCLAANESTSHTIARLASLTIGMVEFHSLRFQADHQLHARSI